ncbi:MAG: hypothetical protein K0R09_3138 [Clostridiales bacterium]|nr:hypothetical protein [Clostridiales bacterium]
MGSEIIKSILEKSGSRDLLNILTRTLSASELNSLMMEVYKLRCDEITPTALMKAYEANKYVKPAFENPIKTKELELSMLKAAERFSFTPIELSPVAPLGACSAVGTVNQNKILSALRGTEVMADSTNSLALHICSLKRNMKQPQSVGSLMKYCTTHRLIRTQIFDNPRFTPHFKLLCMATAGRDTGSYSFEKENIIEHINFYKTILRDIAHTETFKLKLFKIGTDEASNNLFTKIAEHIHKEIDMNIETVLDMTRIENQYYKGIQFKIYVNIDGSEAEAGDGGFVDWSQKLLENKKERMLISAIGIAPLLILN